MTGFEWNSIAQNNDKTTILLRYKAICTACPYRVPTGIWATILIVVFPDLAQGTASTHSDTMGYGNESPYLAHWCQKFGVKPITEICHICTAPDCPILQVLDKRSIFQGAPDEFLIRLFCCLNKLGLLCYFQPWPRFLFESCCLFHFPHLAPRAQ